MSRASKYVQNERVHDWLQDFFREPDTARLKRGRDLYDQGKVSRFEGDHDGFIAKVKGSGRRSYDVNCDIDAFDENGLPDFEHFHVECTCPDWVDICKHSICAVIYYASQIDKQPGDFFLVDMENNLTTTMNQVNEELQHQLQQLENLAGSSKHSILSLGEAPFWKLSIGFDKAMEDVHHVVTSSMQDMKDNKK